MCTCASASGSGGHCALILLGEHADGYAQACGPGWVLMHTGAPVRGAMYMHVSAQVPVYVCVPRRL